MSCWKYHETAKSANKNCFFFVPSLTFLWSKNSEKNWHNSQPNFFTLIFPLLPSCFIFYQRTVYYFTVSFDLMKVLAKD